MLILETGQGLPNANSYVSLASFISYCATRNLIAGLSTTDGLRENALIRATDYIDANYAFKRVPLTDTQALQCPRFNETAVDPRVVKAVCELALIALSRDLFAVDTATKDVISEEKSLGRLSKKTTYQVRAQQNDPYPQITKLLGAYASRRGASASSMQLRG